MMNSPKPIQQDLETPVGWWRCTRIVSTGTLSQFEIGELYPCLQNGRSKYPQGTPIPIHRRSYRIFSDLSDLSQSAKTPFWDGPSQSFSCPHTQFEFVRRFTRREQTTILAQGCDPHAFDSLSAVKPVKLGFLDRIADWLLSDDIPRPKELQTPSKPLKKYFFKYAGSHSGERAVVYNRTRSWGDIEVASFKNGNDAQEYIDFKNAKYRGYIRQWSS
jgi:hypothetical protein